MLNAADPDGAPIINVEFDLIIFLTIVSIVFIIYDFPVPPHPITVARNGTYLLSFLRNLKIVFTAAKTKCCCSVSIDLIEYSVPYFFGGNFRVFSVSAAPYLL